AVTSAVSARLAQAASAGQGGCSVTIAIPAWLLWTLGILIGVPVLLIHPYPAVQSASLTMRKLRYCWDCRDWYIRVARDPACECNWRDDVPRVRIVIAASWVRL